MQLHAMRRKFHTHGHEFLLGRSVSARESEYDKLLITLEQPPCSSLRAKISILRPSLANHFSRSLNLDSLTPNEIKRSENLFYEPVDKVIRQYFRGKSRWTHKADKRM